MHMGYILDPPRLATSAQHHGDGDGDAVALTAGIVAPCGNVAMTMQQATCELYYHQRGITNLILMPTMRPVVQLRVPEGRR